MKTNYLLSFLIVFSFLALPSFSISTNFISKTNKIESVIEEDTFNIMASHGIFLRDSANLTSKKLAKLPYATKLIFLNQDTISEELIIQETKYFEIKGRMQKVKVISQIDSLNDLEGYVFDGYLTKFPVPELDYKGTVENNYLSADLNYLKSNFKESEKYDIEKREDNEDWIIKWKKRYEENIIYEYNESTPVEVPVHKITIPNLSIREAYFFSVVLFFIENNEYNEGNAIVFDENNSSFKIEPNLEAGCFYSIYQSNNNEIIIEYECWGC
ncbi:hypothetical protein WAF17_12870 [Bernardetia sp. ABR2-2B]|uniref:hypothetical protein n=1 Tax=Bernardetia sp. ABR2-2B TaxID=3127472 RepID=UPI0030D06631